MHVTACELFYLNIDLKKILALGDGSILSRLSSLVFLLTPLLFFRVKVLVLTSSSQITESFNCINHVFLLFPHLVSSRSF